MTKQLLSKIPAINKILLLDEIQDLIEAYNEVAVKSAIKSHIEEVKQGILNEELTEVPSLEIIVSEVSKKVEKEDKNSLRRVINATGTILHTNLGRSLLSQKIKENIESVAFNYSNLEFDIDNKKRGSRYVHLIDIIKKLTGAEDVLVVNNNAAAVMLTLNTLVKDKEIVVSRGELVEIGGAFRIPEIIKLSGGTPVEVGTTNKTHLKDYENAINDNTGALLKVHTSNYKILGFTKDVSNEEISYLARENEIVSINDLGSGQFIDFTKYGLPYEPTVKEVLDSGIDIVTFSGDKLLGGPQAGIIVGKKEYIDKMKKNQLTRTLRVDKMTIAALEATLKLYLDEKEALEHIPTLHMISLSKERLFGKADVLKTKLSDLDFKITIAEDKAEVGGGSYPASYLESIVVKLEHPRLSATDLERRLLEVEIPIITRIKDNELILDMRTLRSREFDLVNITIFDAQEIQSISNFELGYDVNLDIVKKQIRKLTNDNKHNIIIGFENEQTRKIIGFVHAELYESLYMDTGLNILGLAVNSNFQGQGIGKKLMSAIEDYALKNNISYIRLNSNVRRIEAHKFYESIGYVCDKTQKRLIKKL